MSTACRCCSSPATCLPAEGVFACELRLSNASIIFIQLGTGDRFAWKDYEATYRAMLETPDAEPT